MNNFQQMHTAMTVALRSKIPQSAAESDEMAARDRGSVSIEQVLWYAAAAISVAGVATVIWNQIRTTAGTAPALPTAP